MKILCISDIHGHLPDVSKFDFDMVVVTGDLCPHHPSASIPPGHFSDMTFQGHWLNAYFGPWVKAIQKPVVVIAGNHDFILAERFIWEDPAAKMRALAPNLTYLECGQAVVNGLKLYGSPWSPFFYDWAFNFPSKEEDYIRVSEAMYGIIPDDVDIVLTHGPSYGCMDACEEKVNGEKVIKLVGCRSIKKRLDELKNVKLHVFGHIHHKYGVDMSNRWISVNASLCNERNKLIREPILIEI